MAEKLWYAVQTGDCYDWDYGSFDYEEALEMAKQEHLYYPDEEIRIVTIEEGTDKVAIEEEIVY